MVVGLGASFSWFFFFKQKTAYEIRPRDWSSDVCSSDRARIRKYPGYPGWRPAGIHGSLFATILTSNPMQKLFRALFTRENLLAILLCLILIALVIFTTDTSQTWIYQGF